MSDIESIAANIAVTVSELEVAKRVLAADFGMLGRESFAKVFHDSRVAGMLARNAIAREHAEIIYLLGYLDGAAKYHAIRTGK